MLPYLAKARAPRRSLESWGRYGGGLVLAVFLTSFIAFVAGFFGPLLLLSTPGRDPLPFLGIFITGPVGAVVGLIVFWAYAFGWRRDHSGAHSTSERDA